MADHPIRRVLRSTLVRLHLAPDEELQLQQEQAAAAHKAFQANLEREQRLMEQERLAREQEDAIETVQPETRDGS